MNKILLLITLAIFSCGSSDNPTVGITSTPNFVVGTDGAPIAGSKILICSSEDVSLTKKLDIAEGRAYDICKILDSTVSNEKGEFEIPEKYANRTISLDVSFGDTLSAFIKNYKREETIILKKAFKYSNNIAKHTSKLDSTKNYFAMLEGTPYVAPIVDGAYDFSLIPQGNYTIIVVIIENKNVTNVVVDIEITVTIDKDIDSTEPPTIIDTIITPKNDTISLDSLLLAHWSFDDSNSNDELGIHNGTNFGNIMYVDGVDGKAAQFDGSSYIDLGNVLLPKIDYSITLFIKSDSLIVSGSILSNHGNKTNVNLLIRKEVDGYLDSEINKGEIFYDLTGADYKGIKAPSVKKYDHIVQTVDKDFVKFYINGVLEKSIYAPGDVVTPIYNLHIGTWAGNPGRDTFTGIIDEVKIYNKVLSPNEISKEYNDNKI